MENRNEVRESLANGEFAEVMAFMKIGWPEERGERVLAEIGNDDQVWEYMELRKGKHELKRVKRGWREVLCATGYGEYVGPDFEAKVVMIDGGRTPIGKMMGLRFRVGIYKDGVLVKNELIEDVIESTRPLNIKRVMRVKTSALDLLEDFLKGLSFEERKVTVVKSG